MNATVKKISVHAAGRNVAVSFAVYCLAIVIMIIVFLPRLERFSSLMIMDLTFNYGPDYAYNLLTSLGPEGRSFYVLSEFLDFLYLIIYSIFFTLLVTYLFKKAGLEGKPVFNLVLVAPVIGLFDLSENFCFLGLLFTFPARHDALVRVANVFTLSKWLACGVFVLLLLAGLVMLALKRFGAGARSE